jgi:hypothetical protein
VKHEKGSMDYSDEPNQKRRGYIIEEKTRNSGSYQDHQLEIIKENISKWLKRNMVI